MTSRLFAYVVLSNSVTRSEPPPPADVPFLQPRHSPPIPYDRTSLHSSLTRTHNLNDCHIGLQVLKFGATVRSVALHSAPAIDSEQLTATMVSPGESSQQVPTANPTLDTRRQALRISR